MLKTPDILVSALRQHQRNDCSGLIAAFDHDETVKIFVQAIEQAYMAGQTDAMVDISYRNAKAYTKIIIGT